MFDNEILEKLHTAMADKLRIENERSEAILTRLEGLGLAGIGVSALDNQHVYGWTGDNGDSFLVQIKERAGNRWALVVTDKTGRDLMLVVEVDG